MKVIVKLAFLLLCVVNISESARILAVIIAGAYSNQAYFQVLWRELALRGHEVVVLTTHPTHENLTNLKEIDMSPAKDVYEKGIRNIIGNNANKLAALSAWMQLFLEMAETQYALPQVQNIINNPKQKFDLIITQVVFPAYYVLKDIFECPLIGVHSMDLGSVVHESMGNPTHSVLYPYIILINSLDNTFSNRVVSFLGNLMITHSNGVYSHIDELNRKYIRKDVPDSKQFMTSLDMLFINNNPLFNEVRAVTPSTISLAGGMHIKPPKKLPTDLQTFMDDSPQGVVYFSLGSNVKSTDLTNSTLHVIMETFSQLPYNILWKYEDLHIPRKLNNVKILQWAPQQDILRHKNIKLFITQAGLQSLEEALFTHVPVIAIPFIADQNINALKLEAKEVGLKMNYNSLTVQELKEGIIKVITDPKYKNNMKRIAEQIQDQPMTPLERAVWWTEYILRHKTGEHLKGPKLPYYQYFYVDVILFLLGCVIIAILGLYWVCKFVYKFVKCCFLKRNKKIRVN